MAIDAGRKPAASSRSRDEGGARNGDGSPESKAERPIPRTQRSTSRVRTEGEHLISQETLGYELRLVMGDVQDQLSSRLQMVVRTEVAAAVRGEVAAEVRRLLLERKRSARPGPSSEEEGGGRWGLRRMRSHESIQSTESLLSRGSHVAQDGKGGEMQRAHPRDSTYVMLSEKMLSNIPEDGRHRLGENVDDIKEAPDSIFERQVSKERFSVSSDGRLEEAYDDALPPAAEQQSRGDTVVGRVSRLIGDCRFDLAVGLLIVANALCIGAQTEYMAMHRLAHTPYPFGALELAFMVVFTLELLLRLYVHRRAFFTMAGCKWNIFDFLLVATQLLEGLLHLASSLLSDSPSVGALRVLRVLRLARILRLVRVLRLVAELRQIVYSLVASLKPFCITFALLLMSIYIVGIWLTQLVLDFRVGEDSRDAPPNSEAESLDLYFSTLGRTVLTLFEAVAGGLSWDAAVAPLMKAGYPWLGVMFPAFVAFTNFAICNVITGVFVQALLEKSQEMKELDALDNIRRLFAAADEDGSGYLSWEEFSAHADTEHMRCLFEELDIRMSEAQSMFRLFDHQHTGDVSMEDFTQGCLHLRGPAKSMDLGLLKQDMRRLAERFNSFSALHASSAPAAAPATSPHIESGR